MKSNLSGVVVGKQGQVRVALENLAKRDGVAVPQNDVLDVVSRAYLVPIQCLWVRVIDVSFVEKYADIVGRVAVLLKKFDFNAIIRAYRLNYTNLYTQKTSKGRKYSLSKADFYEFVEKVEKGAIVISSEKPKKENVVKNSLASRLFNQFAQNTSTATQVSTQSTPKQAPKSSKKRDEVKEKPVKKGFFTKIDMNAMEVSKFYRIITKNNEKLYVWLVGANKTHLQLRDYKKVVVSVAIADITQVESYTKAVWANR